MSLTEIIQQVKSSADLTVDQVIGPRILQCDHEHPIAEVARRMHEAGRSSIIVMRDGEPVGIWTERDALRLDLDDPAALRRPVSAVMSSPVKTISRHLTLQEVTVRFRTDHVRHYLVVDDDNHPLGVVTQTDVVLNHGIEHYLHLRSVETSLHREPLWLAQATPLGEAAQRMREERTDAALVRYRDDSVGILTERDVVRGISRNQVGIPVGELASRPLITVTADTSLFRARATLVESRVRHIAISREESGEIIGLLSFSDILSGIELVYLRELKDALEDREQALHVSRRNLQLAEKVIENALEGIMITDARGLIVSVNPYFTRLTGYQPEEVIGRSPAVISSGRHGPEFYDDLWRTLHRKGYWQGEVWNRRKNGEIFPELLTITAIHDEQGALTHYAALFSDISEMKDNEQRISLLAYYDPLTELPNRRLFRDRLEMAILHAHRSHTQFAVIFIDLDRFKRVNDSLGHTAGDELLRRVATRLREAVREDDTVARMGGDEFVVMAGDLTRTEDATQAARRIAEAMAAPIALNGQEMVVTCSIGISLYPNDGVTMEELVGNADAAMYRAKDLGRNNLQLYSPEINARTLEHFAMENSLRKALEGDGLAVYFQPINGADGTELEAEALLRWDLEGVGRINPGDFIPMAEEAGLIVGIGEWTLDRVCATLAEWDAQGLKRMRISVNISAIQFRDHGFPRKLREILECHGIDPPRITLELTESVLAEEAVATIRAMNALRRMGVRIDLDDFGIGYSSLNYLKSFPINRLKIDRSFVNEIDSDAKDRAIVRAVIALAHGLGLEVVAEGVEQEAQRAILVAEGCEWLQGFLFSEAVPADAFAERFLSTPASGLPVGRVSVA